MKKWIALLMAALLLLTPLSACGGNGGNAGGEGDAAGSSGTAKTETKSKAKDGAVHIKTPEDMAEFARRVNDGETELNAVLDADIDMSGICGPSVGNWTPIKDLAGEFDGSGHVISGLYCVQSETAAPFATLKGVIKDLELKDVVMESTEKYAAGLAISLSGEAAVENCRVSGSVKGYQEAGGITTYTYDDTRVENCVNEASVEGGRYDAEKRSFRGYAAGIVSGPSGGTIRACVNRGEITGAGSAAGGIIGSSDKRYTYVEDCVNEGKVQNTAAGALSNRYAGGIAGTAGNNTILNRCVNKGAVSGNSYTAGIVAYSSYAVVNCANHGPVAATTDDGQAYGISFTVRAGFINCYNTGDITTEHYASGLGYSPNVIGVNLYNTGTVTCTGGDYAVMSDTDSGLFNVWSKEGGVILPEGHDGQVNAGSAAPEAVFTDGTILDALNAAADQLNSGSLDGYDAGVVRLLEKFREECDAELSGWVSGADSLPRFDWE